MGNNINNKIESDVKEVINIENNINNENKLKTDSNLKNSLIKALFRFRKVGHIFNPGNDINMGEIFLMNAILDKEICKTNHSCVSELQSMLNITKPAISQMYSSLEKKGYINREIDTNDRRKINVTLTKEGRESLVKTRQYTSNMFDEIIKNFGEDETYELIGLFNRFSDVSEEVRNKNPFDNTTQDINMKSK